MKKEKYGIIQVNKDLLRGIYVIEGRDSNMPQWACLAEYPLNQQTEAENEAVKWAREISTESGGLIDCYGYGGRKLGIFLNGELVPELQFKQKKEEKPMKNLKDTIEMMTSEDYKERFKAEYWQTKIRYEKLHKMCIKYEADTLKFRPSCSLNLLKEQKRYMELYLHSLEIRAELEGINLEE